MSGRKIALGVGAGYGGLFVYNMRWEHYNGAEPKSLPVVTVQARNTDADTPKRLPVVLIHGMWHGPRFYRTIQERLAEQGYTSHAVSTKPGERFFPGGTQKELVADLEMTLDELDLHKCVILGTQILIVRAPQ